MIESQTIESTCPAGLPEMLRTWTSPAPPWAHLVLAHGLGEHSGRYEHVGSAFAEAGIGVRSFDLLGHGRSGGASADIDDFSLIHDQIEGHVRSLRKTGLPVALYGHSLGGLLSLEYALGDREPVDALVLSAPGLTGGKAWQRALAGVLGKVIPRVKIGNAFDGGLLSRDPAVGEAYFADPLVTTKTSIGMGRELFAAGDRCRSSLDRLSCPTLVIHGGADRLVPPDASLPLTALPNVERRLYPKLRHELHNEPEGPEVIAEVIGWLRTTLTGG